MRFRYTALYTAALAAALAFPAGVRAAVEKTDTCLNGSYTFELEKCSGNAWKLDDLSQKSCVRIVSGSRVRLTENAECTVRAKALYLSFQRIPESFTLTWLGPEGSVLGTDEYGTENDPVYFNSLCLKEYAIDLPEGAAGLEFVSGSDGYLAEMRLYASAAELPETAEHWLPSYDKADLLFVVAHPDDEQLLMGGIVPLYEAERGKKVQMVYMTADIPKRKNEALRGLWSNGQRHMPVFLDMVDKMSDSLNAAITIWERAGLDPAGILVEQIRRFRPEVVVSHDTEGEYGHGAHRATAYYIRPAAEQAADPAFYPESAEKYGVWQVKKLYLHLYGEPDEQTRLPVDEPLAAFDGKTAFEMARIGYEPHSESQGDDWISMLLSRKYDCSVYGLAFTTVGPDEKKNDFFEHIEETSK